VALKRRPDRIWSCTVILGRCKVDHVDHVDYGYFPQASPSLLARELNTQLHNAVTTTPIFKRQRQYSKSWKSSEGRYGKGMGK
jgi:hypothetical protein